VGTFLGWGLVTNGLADWLTWQGYLLEPFGMGSKTDGAWAFANVGVFVAFAVGFVGWWLLGRSVVARQEATTAARVSA
jgi:nucleobase:cation symporter-1, NCS1 family